MKTLVKTMNRPNAKVRMSNIVIDIKTCKFSMTLGVKQGRQKLFREETISGKLNLEVKKWLTQMTPVKVQVPADNELGYEWIDSGNKLTGFQKFLNKQSIEFKPGILSTMVFESDNNSENYAENPFKIIRYADGNVSLTLVNIAPVRVIETADPTTGEVTTNYKQKFIKIGESYREAYISKKYFVRYMVQEIKEVVQFEPQPVVAQ